MRKEHDYAEEISIQQLENGYMVIIGSACTGTFRERYVFQSFTELVNFLNEHFTHRNDFIFTDYKEQTAITLKNK
jgi:hypothetical protein